MILYIYSTSVSLAYFHLLFFFYLFIFLFLIFICSQLKDPHCYFSTVVSNMSFLSARSIFSIFPHSYLFTICHFHDSITLVSHNSACDLYYLDPLLQNCCLASYSPYMFVCALPLSYLSVNICSCSYWTAPMLFFFFLSYSSILSRLFVF